MNDLTALDIKTLKNRLVKPIMCYVPMISVIFVLSIFATTDLRNKSNLTSAHQ